MMLASRDMGRSGRILPRVTAEAFCTEHTDEGERHALILDFSESGLRLQRPVGGPRVELLQLEFEIPEVDEVVWATGEVCFDQIWRVLPGDGSLSGVLRTSGVRIVSAAERHQRLLRDYVNDTWRSLSPRALGEHLADTEWFYRSALYRHG